ncbi:MAG: type II toxin-antitoxin system Phd/YefM family antitoxin [Anaerolineae bacterium]|jgi:prevent-host-death family protein|uniref:Type II toxin-antitoxin system prevent-host-death family antitoxin n=1 Tax=Thermanaerothrix solaris TaxID=3058434 RepID=A0ABU3NTA5_9CHLR|nr:type II toxin-antitoxin system prevent-host-death family antitoxin [Thermanaerothrix sp. 4228-RoL]MDT8899448.1 type II toxin-antitoxin system prevent-host-death family antitoxin [Thermanaerothrix sp. 4228-RoL]
MPEYVGIRVLKARAGEIVRKVQQGMRYVVSVRGRPVALIIPVEPVSEAPKPDAWDALYRAGALLEWKTSRTTEELLDEVRG